MTGVERETKAARLLIFAAACAPDQLHPTRPEEVLERLRGATVAVVNKLPLRAEVLARLPTLRLIAVAATGTDNIDLEFCREHSIAVSNVRGYA